MIGPITTVIDKANQLMEEQGKEAAIKYFRDKIDAVEETRDFAMACKIIGWQTAIDYIEGEKIKFISNKS